MIDPYKNLLRTAVNKLRDSLSFAVQQKKASQICAQIAKLNEYRYAKRIALYQATKGEVNLLALWEAAPLQGKYCYFPSLSQGKKLLFLPATPATTFAKNKYGIEEPAIDKQLAIAPEELDLIFLPLVLFDNQGSRVGMGAGYYDRTLAATPKPLLIGIAYEFQRSPYLKRESWDLPLDAVVTEKGVTWFDNTSS